MKTKLRNYSLFTLGGRAWALRREVLPHLAELAQLAANTEGILLDNFADGPKAARRPRTSRRGGGVAVVPLTGVLTPRGSLLSMLFGGGGGSLQDFREEFAEAVASPDVGAIVIDVDSPGGLVDLVPEAAADVREARGTKPIVAVSNTQACSGAYWIAAQADELVVTPSGCVGSVGVYVQHLDFSGADEQAGVEVTFVYAGKYKVEGNDSEPLGEEAKAAIQEEVDHLYGMFVDDVAAGRGVTADQVRSGYGEGRALLAGPALEAGMVDRVATLEEVIAGLLSESNGGASALAERAAARLASAEPAPAPAAPAPADPPADDPPPAAAAEPETPDPEPAEIDDEEPAAGDPPVEEPDDDEEPDQTDAQARALLVDVLA